MEITLHGLLHCVYRKCHLRMLSFDGHSQPCVANAGRPSGAQLGLHTQEGLGMCILGLGVDAKVTFSVQRSFPLNG